MFGDGGRRTVAAGAAILMAVVLSMVALPQAAEAIHFYRGPGSDCSPADGALTDDNSDASQADVVVSLLHNTYHDHSTGVPLEPAQQATGVPVTQIEVGQTVTWIWNSEHCHSVTSTSIPSNADSFDSGFHYPEETPDTPGTPSQVAGIFAYPVPEFGETTLSFTHTFEEPGTYRYVCVHHGLIGMRGVVIVE